MNLLELMLKDEIEWPVGAEFAVQDRDRALKFDASRPELGSSNAVWVRNNPVDTDIVFLSAKASNWRTSIITREEYQAAGGKMLINSAADAATAKQATPKGSGNPILGMVLADLTNRALEGAAKYGEPLKAHNGRNPLWDAYQEALDLAMYLRQAIEEQQ